MPVGEATAHRMAQGRIGSLTSIPIYFTHPCCCRATLLRADRQDLIPNRTTVRRLETNFPRQSIYQTIGEIRCLTTRIRPFEEPARHHPVRIDGFR